MDLIHWTFQAQWYGSIILKYAIIVAGLNARTSWICMENENAKIKIKTPLTLIHMLVSCGWIGYWGASNMYLVVYKCSTLDDN